MPQLLAVDVEATCWLGPPPKGQRQEIIEVGICPIAADSCVLGPAESLLVAPKCSELSPFCRELTGLDVPRVMQAPSWPRVCRTILARHGHCTWMGWGEFEPRIVREQCRADGARFPFGGHYLNLQHLCALLLGWDRDFGVRRAMRWFGHSPLGKAHRAADDALNTAHIWNLLWQRVQPALLPLLSSQRMSEVTGGILASGFAEEIQRKYGRRRLCPHCSRDLDDPVLAGAESAVESVE